MGGRNQKVGDFSSFSEFSSQKFLFYVPYGIVFTNRPLSKVVKCGQNCQCTYFVNVRCKILGQKTQIELDQVREVRLSGMVGV